MNSSRQVEILIVEDNPTDVLTLREYFAEAPTVEFKLHYVERLAGALDFLRTRYCDVILLDLGLPDSQGVETFSRIHEAAPEVPVLVLTGLNDEAVGTSALKRGAQDYLIKNEVQPTLLEKAILYAIERQRNMSELKLQAARLQASEARVRTLIEAAIDAIFVIGAEAGVRYVNPAAEQMFGRKTADLLSQTFPFPLGTDHLSEIEIRLDHGEKRLVEMRLSDIQWDGESVQLAWLRDITDRKRMEEAMIRAEKMQALGTLAGGIAHDFNNILLTISGNAKLALEELPPDRPAYDNVLEIAKAGSRATALTRKILSFSQQQETRQQTMQVQPVVEEALSLLRTSLPMHIEIHTSFPAGLSPISADASQVQQIIVNLAANAVDAIGNQPGALEVTASPIHLNGNGSSLSTKLPPGNYVRLSLRDTGTGIDKNTVPRIFEPFFTTKPQGRGTGMGLAIVHGIMKNHLGEVTVYSEVGKGTVFNLYFPVAEQTDATIPPATVPLLGRGQNILYVDDEEPLVLLITRTLKRLGYRVTGFTDPVAALKAFQTHPSDFQAVVTDLAMPQMSGIDFAEEVKHIRSDIPVIITTGYVRPQDQELAFRVGVRELILKPDTVEELGNALHRQLAGDQTRAIAAGQKS
jgi:signal transduction histidine kinase